MPVKKSRTTAEVDEITTANILDMRQQGTVHVSDACTTTLSTGTPITKYFSKGRKKKCFKETRAKRKMWASHYHLNPNPIPAMKASTRPCGMSCCYFTEICDFTEICVVAISLKFRCAAGCGAEHPPPLPWIDGRPSHRNAPASYP